MSQWNPRYAAYAKAHGMEPEAIRQHDRDEWPGGCAIPFVSWNRTMLQKYKSINPAAFMDGYLVGHAAYDSWLQAEIKSATPL